MWEKFKGFFATKYRIVPVYQDNKKCGFAVHKKSFLSYWMVAKLATMQTVRNETELLIDQDAFFKTEEEAVNFINSQKETL